MNLRVAALLATTAACCSRGPAPRVADEPTPSPADAAPVDAPPPIDAPDPIDAPPPPIDAPSAPPAADARPTGSGYRIDRMVKGKITKVSETGRYITIEFESRVERGWKGDLWDEHLDRPVPGTRFHLMGVRGDDGTIGTTSLKRDLRELAGFDTVRVHVEYK